MTDAAQPLGVLLAGGAGRRIGGDKALVELAGRPMLRYPLDVLHAVLGEVVVVCKEHTPLPELDRMAAIWCEADEDTHPLIGVRAALRQGGRAIVACAADLPFVTAEVVRALLAAAGPETRAVVPRAGGRLQPLLAHYAPAALPALDAMAPDEPATAVVERLEPVVVDFGDERPFFNVNHPEDVLHASALLSIGG